MIKFLAILPLGRYRFRRAAGSPMVLAGLLLIAGCAYSVPTAIADVSQAVPGPYAAVDARALAAPEAVTGNIKSLAAYLAPSGMPDLQKTRAIFRWVTANVDYDTEGYRTGDYGDLTPDGMLRRRKGVCSGYANLFEALATAAGLEVVTVHGYAKGLSYAPGVDPSDATNHAWNAVRIDGSWRLLDSTWGAGAMKADTGTFERAFDEFYFLPAPQNLLFSHYPSDPKWQLISRPMARKDFLRRVRLRPTAIRLGVRPVSHPDEVITASGEVKIELAVPQGVSVSAVLEREGEGTRDRVAVRRIGEDRVELTLRPEMSGSYQLDIFAGAKDSRTLSWALEYSVGFQSGYSIDNRSGPT